MENIGDGENVKRTGVPNTAEPSQPSRPTDKQRTKKTKPPTTREEAAELLTSALSYCLEAGLIVSGYNEGQTLILCIDGLQYADEKIQVTPPQPSVTAGVTVSVADGVTV
jgi:hypothetical protein